MAVEEEGGLRHPYAPSPKQTAVSSPKRPQALTWPVVSSPIEGNGKILHLKAQSYT